MPLYEYQCDVCDHRFEVIQKFSDPHIDTCPTCGGEVHKLFSSPAIQFKGSGFYITDYPKSGRTDGATTQAGKAEGGSTSGASESKGESKSESKGESKSETKSESKAESKSESKSAGSSSSTPASKE